METLDGLLLDIRDHVAIVTFNRPEKLNALTRDHMAMFGRLCRRLAIDPEVRAIVITGAGRGFSSGADLASRPEGYEGSRFAAVVRNQGTELDFISPLLNLNKPTIAAVNGIAVGAGLGIALSCDIRLCGRSGAFLPNFVHLGLPAIDGVSYLLPRIVGKARALELLYSGSRIDAAMALDIGLVNHVFADEDLMAQALEMATRFARAAPVAVQATRQVVVGGLDKTWAEALSQQELAYLTAITFGSGDIAEAQAARVEKRLPQFTGVLPSHVPAFDQT